MGIRDRNNKIITIISGLPRSGTSMMMKMLEAGGMKVLVDNIRKPDADNPGGYYEYEKVKKIKDDKSWLNKAEGKAVKMVSELLFYLPDNRNYKVIFMQRKIEEIIASQNKMLEGIGKTKGGVSEVMLAKLFEKHLAGIYNWLKIKENIEVLYIHYNNIINYPLSNAIRIKNFSSDINILEVGKMVNVLAATLYRQRR
ncbi:hypothetical protein ES705_08619 [subsurface metagenome]